MRVAFFALVGLLSIAWLASGHAAVQAPKFGVAVDTPYRPIADGCGYGRHWVEGYTLASGAAVEGACQADR